MFATCGFFHVPVTSCTSAIPVHAFNVVVHLNAHRTATFQTPVFQYFSASFRTHTIAKAMNSYSPTDFGLIRSFRHVVYSPKKTGAKAPWNFASYVRGGVVLHTNENHLPTSFFKKGDRRLYNTPWSCQMGTGESSNLLLSCTRSMILAILSDHISPQSP